ncbi:MAG: hypothetical protein R3E58_13530 [Phycisphaerae bacterium]
MRIFDQHLHSWNSFDCQTQPIDNVRRAIDVGLAGLTFTEHPDTHPSEWDGCVYDDAKIGSREILELREQFGDQIFIGKGIEVCYQPERMDFILEFLAAHSFDVILLSLHWASGRAVHVQDHPRTCRATNTRSFYLEAMRECTAQFQADETQRASAISNPGTSTSPNGMRFGCLDLTAPRNEPKLVDAILQNCLDGIIPEINTSTLRQGLSSPMPGMEVVQRYAKLGGTMMSFGSIPIGRKTSGPPRTTRSR